MEYALPLAALWAANLLAVISPGPAFVIVAQTAMTTSRAHGLAAAAGMIIGAWAWAIAAVFGLAFIFVEFAWLHRIVQFAGGVYLVYLAVKIWRGASVPVAMEGAGSAARTPARAFAVALASQLSNPKVVVFFGSVFVALLPVHAPAWVWGATLALILFNETVWYLAVATLFAAAPARRAYGRAKSWLDRVMAGVLGALGLKLVLDSR